MTRLTDLPPPLRRQLALLAGRVRRQRLLGGVSVLLLFLAVGLLLLFAIDTWWGLTRPVLRAAVAALAAGGLGAAWLLLLRPLWRGSDARSLAALIERHYPQLSERLSSSVALAEQRDLTNGAPALVALLFAETAAQTQALDVRAAAPARPSLRLAAAALAALLVAAAPALLWAEPYHNFSDRLLSSWLTADEPGPVAEERQSPTAAEPAQLDVAASRVTVTPPPYADPREHPPQTLPPLTPRTALQFGAVVFELRFTRPVAVVYLELTHLTTAARQRLSLKTTGTQCRLEVPLPEAGIFAVSVRLETEDATAQPLPTLTVLADAPPIFARPPELADVVVSGGTAGWPGGRSDTPFHELLDVGQTRQVPPNDRLPLRLTVLDDVGVERVRLEYRVNHGPVRHEDLRPAVDVAVNTAKVVGLLAAGRGVPAVTIPCHSNGRRALSIDHLFQLAGKVKDGDVVAFRFAAVDNRRVGELGPQTAYWPEPEGTQARWFLLRVRKEAPPRARQEIQDQRDHVKEQVEAIHKALREERTQLAKVQPQLTPAVEGQLAALRRQNEQIKKQLEQLADSAAEKPALRDLATRARQLAEGQLHRSAQALSDAQRSQVDDVRRDQLLKSADEELAQAQRLLDDLNQDNDKLAKDRADQQDLARLAERQAELARQAAELAEKKAPDDPDARKMLEALRLEQEKLAALMKRLTAESPLVQSALNAARAQEAQRLAVKARDLAEQQQKLTMDGDKTFKHLVETKFAELVKRQQELAEKAGQLARDTKAALAVAGKTPADTGATQKAVAALKEANAALAVERQGQAVKELERVADDLGPALDKAAAKDKEAVMAQQAQARQLAAAQKELQEEVRKLAKLPDPLQEKAAAELAKKQEDVAAQTAGLMKQLDQLGKESEGMGGAGKSVEEAATASEEAGTAMKKAQAQAKEGNLGQAQAEREAAVKSLAKAAEQAKQAAEQLAQMGGAPGEAGKAEAGQQAGMALQQGREQMGKAENELARGQLPGAQIAMHQAAQALQRAADQTAEQLAPSGRQPAGPPTESTQSNFLGAAPGGLPSLERFGKEFKKYSGKAWGELPGELQTRLLQDLRARYGADYAELIQRYFEQLARPARKGKG